MISYAQNFEDVMLWRALKHIECGFYVDVGANPPTLDSVTKWFYDNGWRGINIEPIEQWFELLEQERPRDINLNIAAGENNGQLTLFEIADTGLSTINEEIAKKHQQERNFNYSKVVVPQRTLTSICEDYHLAPIHFLKIDVEGAEKLVLQGLDLTRVRPWIVMVEATLPNSPIEDYATWEDKLLQNAYRFVYFDGLNRFYLAEEKEEALGQYFITPPNIFDDFIPYKQCRAENELAEKACSLDRAQTHAIELEKKLVVVSEDARSHLEEKQRIEQHAEDLQTSLTQSLQAYRNLEQSSEQLAEQIVLIKRSMSWRITSPLRSIGSVIGSCFALVVSFTFSSLSLFAKHIVGRVLSNPKQAVKINKLLLRYTPFIHRHLVRFAVNRGLVPAHNNTYKFVPAASVDDLSAVQAPVDTDNKANAMSPRAREFFAMLTKTDKSSR